MNIRRYFSSVGCRVCECNSHAHRACPSTGLSYVILWIESVLLTVVVCLPSGPGDFAGAFGNDTNGLFYAVAALPETHSAHRALADFVRALGLVDLNGIAHRDAFEWLFYPALGRLVEKTF